MDYLEDSCDLMDFEEEGESVDVLKCDSCGTEFEVLEGEEPKDCPACDIEFLPEGDSC